MRNFFSLFIGLALLCPIFTAFGQSNARTMQGAIFEMRNVSGLSGSGEVKYDYEVAMPFLNKNNVYT